MFLGIFFMIHLADAVYFSMANIRVTVPIDKGKLPPGNDPLVTLSALGEPPLRYSIDDNNQFFKISPTTGDVFFTQRFLDYNLTDLDNVSARISVQDSSGNENRTSLKLEILPLPKLDCDYIVEDLCFWKSAEYHIFENTKPTLIGSLASPYLAEMCASYVINYNLLSKNDEFRIVTSGIRRSIETTKSLDREMESLYSLEVLCTVENSKHSIRNVSKNITVVVLDVDDNPIRAQEFKIQSTIQSRDVAKGQMVAPQDLIFYDMDTPGVNHYEPLILNDTQNILEAQCKNIEDDRLKEIQTVVHCKLKFTKKAYIDKWTHSVRLQLNDTTLTNGTKTITIPIDLHFPNDTGYHPVIEKNKLKAPYLYPSNKVKIFRTAAPLARLIAPDPKSIKDAKYFTVTTKNPKHKKIFNVTYMGGILFVHNSAKLRLAPEFLRVNISWSSNNTRKSDEIEVQIVDEPQTTCENVTAALGKWGYCSGYATRSSCLKSDNCDLGTLGSASVSKWDGPHRCMWRGAKDLSFNTTTHLYATCTPDTDTCPDGVCDALEELHYDICPQDCAHVVFQPAKSNPITRRGISVARGICTCHANACSCEPPQNNEKSLPTKPSFVVINIIFRNVTLLGRHLFPNVTIAL